MSQHGNRIARIENRFIFNAQYKLTAREQKVILYLISNIDPKRQERFHEQIISVKELENVLKADGKKWGGLYEEMQNFTDRVLDKKIRFPTNLKIDGQPFPGKINWFQSIVPVKNERGEVALRFLFAEDLKPFLLQLNEYAQINRLEAAPMNSGHAIRMFQVFKAQRDRMRRHEKVSRLTYEVDELKSILGISDKYSRFNSFRERVLDVVTEEINKYTSLKLLNIEYTRNSNRQVTHLTFIFSEKEPEDRPAAAKLHLPSELELLDTLTKSQVRAYRLLVKRHVEPGIAYRQIVPKITAASSEFIGFEDWYVEITWQLFEKKTDIKGDLAQAIKAGTYVNWLLKDNIFGQNDLFAVIQEQLAARKKEAERYQPDHWAQRLEAKGKLAKEVEE